MPCRRWASHNMRRKVHALVSHLGSCRRGHCPSGSGPDPRPFSRNQLADGTVNLVPASALEKGANSFTEGQAKSRFEEAGITNVAALAKDGDGIWRATGSRAGKSVKLGLDYKGNISAE